MKKDKKKDLEILGLSGIFQGIADEKRTGILYARSGNDEKGVYFKNGNIKMVASPNRPSILAEGMKRAFGQIDDETVEGAFQMQGETGKPLSQILLEIGADQQFIEELCKFQIKEEIFELFIWEDIQFEFSEEETPDELFPQDLLELNIEINPGMLLMEVINKLDIWKEIKKVFPSMKDVPYISADIYEDQLIPEEIHLLSLTDGGRDFEEIFTICRLQYFQMMHTFYEMYNKKYISLKTAKELKEMANLDEYKDNVFKCIKLYERAEELGDKGIDTINWLAEAYESCGLISKAIAKYKELGDVCLSQNNYEGAIKAFGRVITYSPEDLEAHQKYVDALFQNGNFQEGAHASIIYARKLAVEDKNKAIQVLEEAYQHNPLSAEVLDYMGILYVETGKNVEAMLTYTTLANLYKNKGMFEESVATFKKILALDETNVEARIALANTYLLMGLHEEGVAEYKKVGDILRASGIIQNSFGFNYLITVCEKIIEFEPTNLSAREWLADVYLYQQQYDKAKELLLELLEFLKDKDKSENLLSVLQKLVQIEPENREYHRILAETYYRLERYEECTQELICVGDLALSEGIRYIEERLEKEGYEILSESLEAYNSVLLIEPFHLEVRQKRAELLRQLGYSHEAVEEYKLVCNMTKAINNYHDALTALFHIVELAPDYEPSAFLELARLCERQNKEELALNFYKKYAKRCLLRGDFGEVIQTCRKLSILDPKDEEVKSWKQIAQELIKK